MTAKACVGYVRTRSSRSRCQRDRMAGWVISFNFARNCGSAKTSLPKTFRSIDWSGCRIEGPKASMTFLHVSCPGSRTRRAISSVSMTCQPRARRPSASVVLPQAMPPVRPIWSALTCFRQRVRPLPPPQPEPTPCLQSIRWNFDELPTPDKPHRKSLTHIAGPTQRFHLKRAEQSDRQPAREMIG